MVPMEYLSVYTHSVHYFVLTCRDLFLENECAFPF